ncbi:MAG: lipid-A-disaccharide synthase N-terminal domain-containing protein [Chromatiales bacterium]|jgi:lipid-A-disaccharide synthase-like uncharacterized protein|nr:lipid-A-disaccharide synthase N-terminal domain-containing protein [Chromatiales bacterium]
MNLLAAFPDDPGLGWIALGLVGQALFTGRFVVQWLASEWARRSVIPQAFWYLSVAGGVILFIYACARRDPVFMLGQGAGLFVYARNIHLLRRAPGPAHHPAGKGAAAD